MSKKTKKLNINKEKIDEIQTTDELFQEYDNYIIEIKKELSQQKQTLTNEIWEKGPKLLGEIEQKRNVEEIIEKRNKNIISKFINMIMGW